MTSEQKDNLFVLGKSLTKSEKRQFRLYVGRMGSNEDSKFLNLFQSLDKMNRYDEKVILKKGIVTKQQLSNLKAHLYKQIMISPFGSWCQKGCGWPDGKVNKRQGRTQMLVKI